MAGEFILKLLANPQLAIRVENVHRWLIYDPPFYGVYERKPYAKKTTQLIETESEELACKILKGE